MTESGKNTIIAIALSVIALVLVIDALFTGVNL